MENIPFFLSVYHSTMSSSKPSFSDYFGKISGIPMYKKFIEQFHNVEEFEARPDDLVIVTYPKSGKIFSFTLNPKTSENVNSLSFG